MKVTYSMYDMYTLRRKAPGTAEGVNIFNAFFTGSGVYGILFVLNIPLLCIAGPGRFGRRKLDRG